MTRTNLLRPGKYNDRHSATKNPAKNPAKNSNMMSTNPKETAVTTEYERTDSVLHDIATERARQRAKGYGAAHDDMHTDRSIVAAAVMIAVPPQYKVVRAPADSIAAAMRRDTTVVEWPCSLAGYVSRKHEDDYRATLVIAAALLVAEIERVDRLETSE